MQQRQSESGQILVLLVLAFVGILGFSALAIDGGMILQARRGAQNAADSAALAAALARSQGENLNNAALNQAAENGYQNDARSQVQVFNPPRDGKYAPPYRYASQFIQVYISTQIDTAFAHFVYDGPVATTVQAVARFTPPSNVFPGNALHATNESVCDALQFNGSNGTHIIGGHAFSNSEADGTSNASCYSGEKSGSAANIRIEEGGVVVAGEFRNYSGIVTDEGLQENADHEEVPVTPIPDCTGLTTYNSIPHDASTLLPGIYPNGIRFTNSHAEITMEPGMYCVGDEFTMNGGRLDGDGVLIFMLPNADFDLGGNTEVHLKASTNLVDAAGTQWAGMMLYMDPSSTGQVVVTGNGESSYYGSVYAIGPTAHPESQPKCIVSGTGDSIGVHSKVVCNTVKITGSATVHILYREEENWNVPPRIELMK